MTKYTLPSIIIIIVCIFHVKKAQFALEYYFSTTLLVEKGITLPVMPDKQTHFYVSIMFSWLFVMPHSHICDSGHDCRRIHFL